MKASSLGVVRSLTIPTAPQYLDDTLNYYKERTQSPYPLAAVSVTPESSGTVFNQEVTVSSGSDKGFFYLDAMAGQAVGTEVPLGTAGVTVLERREIRVGIRSVHQRSIDGSNDFDAPELTASQIQSVEDYLNNEIFAQANLTVDLVLLGTIEGNYDQLVEDQAVTLSAQVLYQGQLIDEGRLIEAGSASTDSDYEFMIFIVNDVDDAAAGGPNDLGVRAATRAFDAPDPAGRFIYYSVAGLGSLSVAEFSGTIGHELAHAMGCPHPFDYSQAGANLPFDDDYDPDNLMSYFTDGIKLRFYQWIEINPITTPSQ